MKRPPERRRGKDDAGSPFPIDFGPRRNRSVEPDRSDRSRRYRNTADDQDDHEEEHPNRGLFLGAFGLIVVVAMGVGLAFFPWKWVVLGGGLVLILTGFLGALTLAIAEGQVWKCIYPLTCVFSGFKDFGDYKIPCGIAYAGGLLVGLWMFVVDKFDASTAPSPVTAATPESPSPIAPKITPTPPPPPPTNWPGLPPVTQPDPRPRFPPLIRPTTAPETGNGKFVDPPGTLPEGVLAPPLQVVEDLKATRFRLNQGELLNKMVWAEDGNSFYCIEKLNGRLRRISLDGFRELASRTLAVQPVWMSWCSEGLLVSGYKPSQLLLVDPETLNIKQTYTMPEGFRGDSARSQSLVFVGPGIKDHVMANGLAILDLKLNKYVNQLAVHLGKAGPLGYERPTLTPDGKTLFTIGRSNGLYRWRVVGTQIVAEQASPDLIHGVNTNREIQMSEDGKWICLPVFGGNEGPSSPSKSSYLYQTDNLNSPALRVQPGAWIEAFGFDSTNKRIYAQNRETPLVVIDHEGKKLKSYQLCGKAESCHFFLVHPQGGRIVLLCGEGLYYVELPKS